MILTRQKSLGCFRLMELGGTELESVLSTEETRIRDCGNRILKHTLFKFYMRIHAFAPSTELSLPMSMRGCSTQTKYRGLILIKLPSPYITYVGQGFNYWP